MEKKMNMKERVAVVRAMDLLARSCNDEEAMMGWLMCGVADGDITPETKDEDLDYYVEDDTFRELIGCFLRTMRRAGKGGLYVNGVVGSIED